MVRLMPRPPVVLGDAPDAAGSPWLLPIPVEPPADVEPEEEGE